MTQKSLEHYIGKLMNKILIKNILKYYRKYSIIFPN